jgi:hypothetical protein
MVGGKGVLDKDFYSGQLLVLASRGGLVAQPHQRHRPDAVATRLATLDL